VKNKFLHITFLFLFFFAVLAAFTDENGYFTITKKDVEIKVPKGFPPIQYDLRHNKITPERFTLGRRLFYDPILSKDSSISCSFCHQRIAAFAHIDHSLSHGINGLIGKRNVPAIQNMIWSTSFMWDGGVNNLDVQPINPISNPLEMNESLASVISKLQHNKQYAALFKEAWGKDSVTSQQLLKSLAQFTALMISANSRYDKYTRGEETFTASEINGLKLFRANCESCHKEPLFTDNSFRNNGLPMDTSLRDSGREAITGLESDYMKFKVPSLRNVVLTYPYMHDGRFHNLQQVLNHYTLHMAPGKTLDPALARGISLNEQEKADVIAFLKTLTDKDFVYDRRFADPNYK